MSTKLLMAAVAAFVFIFIVDSVFYGVLMADYFANPNMPAEPNMVYLLLGQLIFTLGFAWLYSKSNMGGTALQGGALFGAVVGIMVGLGLNLIFLATMTGYNLTQTLVDAVYRTAVLAAAGALIAFICNRGTAAA